MMVYRKSRYKKWISMKQNILVLHIQQLTWLRGIAALLVIISHVLRATEVAYNEADNASNNFVLSFLDLGNFGVVLFFSLSGATLYLSNSKKVGRTEFLFFYIKRFFRIYPAFFVSLILYIIFGFFFSALYPNPTDLWVEGQFLSSYTLKDIFYYMSFIFNFTDNAGLFNNAYWSLPVEFQYYFIFPVLIILLRFGPIGPLFLAVIFYLLPTILGIPEYSEKMFFLLFSFCGGVVVGYLYQINTFRFSSILTGFILCSFLMLTSAISNSYFDLSDIPLLSRTTNLYSLIAVLSVYVVLLSEFKIYKPVEKFLMYYGTISYSTYLYHNLFIGLAVLGIINFEIFNGETRLFLTLSFTLFASFFAASLSYKYIELPSISLGRWLVNYLNSLKEKSKAY